MATGSDRKGHITQKGWKGVRIRNRKLRNIRPSGAFWLEVTLWNVNRSDRWSRDPFVVPLGVRNIRSSGAFWTEITWPHIGLPLENAWPEVPLGCSLGRPRLSFSSPGFLPLSRHFILI
jgi:hypothetical protein